MFLLTYSYYEDRTVKGVFTTPDKAKKYVRKIMHRDVTWDSPNTISGAMSAYFTGGGYLTIEPVEINPRK
jgi:hypothetical protein